MLFGAAPQGCIPSKVQAGLCRDSPCGGKLQASVEASPPDGRQPHVLQVRRGWQGWGEGMHWEAQLLLASELVSLLWCGEYSVGTHPFFSPLPSTDLTLFLGSL